MSNKIQKRLVDASISVLCWRSSTVERHHCSVSTNVKIAVQICSLDFEAYLLLNLYERRKHLLTRVSSNSLDTSTQQWMLFCLRWKVMLLDGFSSYMFYNALAHFFHASIEQVYWTMTTTIIACVVVIAFVYYFVLRWINKRWEQLEDGASLIARHKNICSTMLNALGND